MQDAGGDNYPIADSFGPDGYTTIALGGTGKFKGITGSGTVQYMGKMSPIRQGTSQGCRKISFNYKLS